MNEYQPIRPPPSRTDGHWGAIGLFAIGALILTIVKPWGTGGGSVGSALEPPPPPPSPTASPSPSPALGFNGLEYNRSIFGNHEPEATWAIWPAGYLVTFGFVIQVPGALSTPTGGSPRPSAAPSAGPGAGPSAGPSASSTATTTPGPDITQAPGPSASDGPIWPAEFDVPDGNHLFLIGVNMPRGYSLAAVSLVRDPGDGETPVSIERLQSPWPDHFAVIGIPTPSADGRLDVWSPGLYRLDMIFEPGRISRPMEIRIAGATVGP